MPKPPSRPPQDAARRAGSALDDAARQTVQTLCAVQARQLRQVAAKVGQCVAAVPPRVPAGQREGFGHDLAVAEVSCLLGVSASAATALVDLATRLTGVLPQALAALERGAIDWGRAKTLAERTLVLDEETARAVTATVLAQADTWAGPWDAPAPRSWTQRVERAVVRVDAEAAAARRQRALAARQVRAWAEAEGTGVLQIRAEATDVAMADQVITDLANAWPTTDPAGAALSMDQRRTDAVINLFRRIRTGTLTNDSLTTGSLTTGSLAAAGLPVVPVRRVHDLGLVLHTDTLFGAGPAADEPAQLRGLGTPTALDARSAQTLARQQLQEGITVQVLLVDATGTLQHVVPLDPATARTCTDQHTLLSAVRHALPHQPAPASSSYHPTAATTRHIHAAAPTCSFYDCPRPARGCDLDHDDPWPRGPTDTTNLDPKCRRHHQHKTHALMHTHLHTGTDGHGRRVTWTLRTGTHITTTPEPLPGCEPVRATSGSAA